MILLMILLFVPECHLTHIDISGLGSCRLYPHDDKPYRRRIAHQVGIVRSHPVIRPDHFLQQGPPFGAYVRGPSSVIGCEGRDSARGVGNTPDFEIQRIMTTVPSRLLKPGQMIIGLAHVERDRAGRTGITVAMEYLRIAPGLHIPVPDPRQIGISIIRLKVVRQVDSREQAFIS